MARKKKTYWQLLLERYKKDPDTILYGLFTGWGILTTTFIISVVLRIVLPFNTILIIAPFLYLALGIIFYFPIRKTIGYKAGYVAGLIIGGLILSAIINNELFN